MKVIRDNLATIVAGVVVAAVLVAAACAFGPWRTTVPNALVVVVHDGEGNEQRLPLDKDASIEVSTSLGANTVVVEHGQARMGQADCPNGDCMRQMPISVPGQQLICLPHKLWVEVVGDAPSASTEMDVDSVAWSDGQNVSFDPHVDLVAR